MTESRLLGMRGYQRSHQRSLLVPERRSRAGMTLDEGTVKVRVQLCQHQSVAPFVSVSWTYGQSPPSGREARVRWPPVS